MEWDTLNLTCRNGISSSYVLWPFRPVSRLARLILRVREPPVQIAINIEGYPREGVVQLLKQRTHDWSSENMVSCLIIGDPEARAHNPVSSIFMIRCFGMTLLRGDSEVRDCVIHTACIAMFLLLGEHSAAYESSRLDRSITLASARCRPHTQKRS